MLGGDDNAGAPNYSAGRTSGFGMHGNGASSGAISGLRQGFGQSNKFCGHVRNLHEQDAAGPKSFTSAKWLGQGRRRAGVIQSGGRSWGAPCKRTPLTTVIRDLRRRMTAEVPRHLEA